MLFEKNLNDSSTSKTTSASAPLLDNSLSTTDSLLLEDSSESSSELGRAWPSSISAQSDYSLFSENKLLLDQD